MIHGLTVIGERINPGFKSTRALFENEDIPGIQALAQRHEAAGAGILNVNIGNRAVDDPSFMVKVVEAIQQVVSIPLSFDFPRLDVQKLCLSAYDPSKAGGAKPIINSLAASRMDLAKALEIMPARCMVMTSERAEGNGVVANATPHEMHATAKDTAHYLRDAYGLCNDDLIFDVSLSTFAADNRGLTSMTLGAIAQIRQDPDLDGCHIMCGLTNHGLMLPKREIAGTKLQSAIERAFLTVAVPAGLDMALATPWADLSPLPEDHPVLVAYRDLVPRTGADFLRTLRPLLRG